MHLVYFKKEKPLPYLNTFDTFKLQLDTIFKEELSHFEHLAQLKLQLITIHNKSRFLISNLE